MSALPVLEPHARVEDLDRLDVRDLPSDATNESELPVRIDWDDVDAAIQVGLEPLHSAIREDRSDVASDAGSSSAAAYPLFSFRRFSRPGEGQSDAVIAGVLIQRRGDRIAVKGDLCWEESGEVLYEAGPPIEVAATEGAVLEAVRSISQRLCGRADLVVRSLADGDMPGPE